MSKLDAAIRSLKTTLETARGNSFSHRVYESNHPEEPKTSGNYELLIDSIQAAIRLLEAAGKVDKDRADWCLQWADNNNFDTLESQHGITRRQWLGTMAKLSILVDALPNKED